MVPARARTSSSSEKTKKQSVECVDANVGPCSEISALYNQALAAAWGRIKAHPVFQGLGERVQGEASLSMPQDDILKYLKEKGFARFDGSVFVGAVTGFDHAPASKENTTVWKEQFYSSTNGVLPETMNHTFKFAAIEGEALRGMPLLSPCEARDALVFRIDEAIQDGADEETLKLWKAAAENAPICIVRCEKSEIQWRQINERESVGKSFKLLYRTAIGRMFEVLDVIMAHERANGVELSAKEVAELWNLHVGDAEIGEKVTDTYVIALQKIRKRIIQDKAAITKLLAADEEFGVVGTPWDSIYKLESLATKIGNRENSDKLLFLIDYIYDRMKSGNVDRADLSSRSMAGKGKPGNKGILDLGLLKYDMVRHALGTLLEDILGDTRMKENVHEVFGIFQTYRSVRIPNQQRHQVEPVDVAH